MTIQAGNTAQTLASTPVEAVAQTAPVLEPSAPADDAGSQRLAQIKSNFAAKEAAKTPKASAPAPATGPAPIEWKEPARGPHSLSGGPLPNVGTATAAPAVAVVSGQSKVIGRAEFQALLDRIDNFNNRSSQKI